MRIKFCGAARTVTGSQHLLDINGKKILLDCGMFQGKREESFRMNRKFIYDPSEIDCVILSHAHIDHSGNLPTLYRKGFRGDIYSTTATRDLCAVMLQDSAHIQERDVEFVNKKRKKKGEQPFNTLYDFDDVRNVMSLFKAVSYHKKFTLNGFGDSVEVSFFDAGHILGSAQILMNINENGQKYKFVFTGDIGRPNLPILKDPEFTGDTDLIISESTYGGRLHEKADGMETQLQNSLSEAMQRGGKIIVPAFSVGRTQEFLYAISKLFEKGSVKQIPVYVDSPLSSNVSEIFRLHHECFDKETSEMISRGSDIFGFSNAVYVRTAEESKLLNQIAETCIIISASGMCEAGRVLHHLANNITDSRASVIIIGYCAPETLGRRLVESRDKENTYVKIFGDEYKVNAKIYVLNSFSAHADKNELLDYFSRYNRKKIKDVFLVHGDLEQQEIFKSSLEEKGYRKIFIPDRGEEVEI